MPYIIYNLHYVLLCIILRELTRRVMTDISSVSTARDITCLKQLFSFPKERLMAKLDISLQIYHTI